VDAFCVAVRAYWNCNLQEIAQDSDMGTSAPSARLISWGRSACRHEHEMPTMPQRQF